MLPLVDQFFFFRSSKYLIRISGGFFSMSAAKRSSVLFSSTKESTLKEAALSEEAITAKSIGANTFHHTTKNNKRVIFFPPRTLSSVKYDGHSIWWLYMVDTLSWVFQLLMMVQLGEPLARYQDIT